MALKGDRREFFHDVEWKFNVVAEAGGFASIDTAGSGGYPGQSANVAKYAADPSGAKPLGILLHDVDDYDTNRQHENFARAGFVTRIGGKVALDRAGRYTTNMVASGVNPGAGDSAYLAANGKVSNVQASGAPKVGTFMNTKDQNGFIKIQVELL